eukprot:CAMPEP_0115859832 /NCGR_PEP_ID=MMETSP0287-20121206/16818_1 /TAXON_ID=412157 /ORGANISM="Chrysochromulina rotalis, Strain UIO044" /LENGTH=278 /DNA_ID=CAMNT_0003314143 /DNA_START=40 /DNA_END=876 /DNA_ORIENTATION=-
MGRCAQLVIGPAGSGKSTFCELMRTHCETLERRVHVVNLDPAAEHFSYPVAADIRELISLEDVMTEMKLGPNGGLIYCMEYLVDNIDWLEEALDELGPEEYVIFDCPGQIELYSHVPAMATIVSELQRLGFRIAASYLLDSQFVADVAKFVSGVLCCLSAMTALELPHVNVLSKCDLLPSRKALDEFLEADASALSGMLRAGTAPSFYKLNTAICELIDEWNMVQFLPLDPKDPDTIDLILTQIDNAIQYHDDVEPKTADDEVGELDDDVGGEYGWGG